PSHAFAEFAIWLVRQIANGCGDEIGAFASQHVETCAPKRTGNDIPLLLKFARVAERKIHLVQQSMRDAELQRGRSRERVELMRFGNHLYKARRTAHPANLPPRQREHLSGR